MFQGLAFLYVKEIIDYGSHDSKVRQRNPFITTSFTQKSRITKFRTKDIKSKYRTNLKINRDLHFLVEKCNLNISCKNCKERLYWFSKAPLLKNIQERNVALKTLNFVPGYNDWQAAQPNLKLKRDLTAVLVKIQSK